MFCLYKTRVYLLFLVTVFMVLFFLVSSQLNASNAGFLKYAVIADFSASDIKQLQEEYIQVLKSNSPGDIHSWGNNKTKNGGEITVIKRYRQNDTECKRLKFKNQSASQSAISYFNFCLIEQQWKLVN